jgi:DNA-binding response OmpR family regulator/anti-sigma regulatory factor (Ser/Thr protein kinase)
MHTTVTQANLPSVVKNIIFKSMIKDCTVRDIGKIRATIRHELQKKHIMNADIDRVLIGVNEVVSNLMVHTPKAPEQIIIEIALTSHGMLVDIADNSAPFADFFAKCENSLKALKNIKAGMENGRGLGLLQQSFSHLSYQTAAQASDGFNHLTFADGTDITKPLKRKTIFIVDDDPVFRSILIQVLNTYYDVVSFDKASDALNAFENKAPDLIISDIMMPEMSGIDLREALSKQSMGDITPFIFISGHNEQNYNSHINKLGIDYFITKPFKPKELLSTLERLLTRSLQLKNKIESNVGDQITSRLHPRLPHVIGAWQTKVKSTVATVGGGDLLLHFQDKNLNHILLADVMGHGVEAKFFSYAYVGYIRSLFHLEHERIHKCEDWLSKLSRAVLSDDFISDHIMTCQALTLHTNGALEISSAGHPKALYYSAQNQIVTYIDMTGPLPGLNPHHVYQSLHLTLMEGDMIFLYTDGFAEVLEDDIQELAEEGLAHGKAIDDYLWSMFEAKAKNDPIKDDATLVTLQFKPPV